MSSRKSTRVAAARENLEIFERGGYVAPGGGYVNVGGLLQAAVSGTRLVRPREAAALLAAAPAGAAGTTRTRVTPESTSQAARRLVVDEGRNGVTALNFASACNPGGGFLNGARAQEEDLACVSGLYACQVARWDYYERNRAHDSMLYTDHLIASPQVPFFRDEQLLPIDAPWCASIITAPAPNAGQARRRGVAEADIEEALQRRAGYVLAVAEALGTRELVLGAWGCGVFKNEPRRVADIFATWLTDARFAGAFEAVTFAILDRRGDTLAAFAERFSAASAPR